MGFSFGLGSMAFSWLGLEKAGDGMGHFSPPLHEWAEKTVIGSCKVLAFSRSTQATVS